MGSGCQDNKRNRPVNTIPDTGVKYTGPAIPSLDICPGDFLDEIEKVILDKLVEFATGEGISLPDADFTQCAILDSFVSCCLADKSLPAIVDGILKTFCQVQSNIDDLSDKVDLAVEQTDYVIDPGCLTVTNSHIDTVLNKLVSEYCSLVDKLTAIFGNLDNPVLNNTIINQVTDSVLNTVLSSIKGCAATDVVKTGSGINAQITINGTVPIGSLLFGSWDATYFDASGKGLPSKGMCGYAVANGANGTINMAGFTPAMATNIPNATLDNLVSPVFNSDADYGTNIGDVKGQVKHKLTGQESGLKDHTHATTGGGTGSSSAYLKIDQSQKNTNPVQGGGSPTAPKTFPINPDGSAATVTSTFPSTTASLSILPSNTAFSSKYYLPSDSTGGGGTISITASGNQDALSAHENRQPTKYVNCIQRIA